MPTYPALEHRFVGGAVTVELVGPHHRNQWVSGVPSFFDQMQFEATEAFAVFEVLGHVQVLAAHAHYTAIDPGVVDECEFLGTHTGHIDARDDRPELGARLGDFDHLTAPIHVDGDAGNQVGIR